MNKKTSLDQRLSYLSLADFDYLSARILLLFGLAHTGFPKAAESFEKLFKLFLILEAKISKNKELSVEDLKNYQHKLVILFDRIKSIVPVKFDKSWREYFLFLQETYHKRYPEHWKSFKYEIDISKLDFCYLYLRSNIARNFPPEEQERVKQFGGFISDGYSKKIKTIIKRRTGKSLAEMLFQDNDYIEKYNLSFIKL